MDSKNTSIENQKAIITDYVQTKFPESSLTFFVDRDRSGYTFEQREGYQLLRKQLLTHQYDVLIVKDFSRFSRRNSRGLVELEDLRDAGVRIISIGDSVDFPTDDDWLKIQFQFLINEMPVTDTSKKVRSVIRRRQAEGQWICAAPYGYVMNRSKGFDMIPAEAEVVRLIYERYLEGWGYKKIANDLTRQQIPTPRMAEQMRREAEGMTSSRRCKSAWSIITIQGILDNDFYTGTLRQGKTSRVRINGKDAKTNPEDHIVIQDHHPAIITPSTFHQVQEQRRLRSKTNYRGVRKYEHPYTGLMRCGDCGSPMFSLSRTDIAPAYTCGAYHRRGRAACTSHHVREDVLDELVRSYLRKLMDSSADMLSKLEKESFFQEETPSEAYVDFDSLLDDLNAELRETKRQRIRDIIKRPDQEELIVQVYDRMEEELQTRIVGVTNQAALLRDWKRTQEFARANTAAAASVLKKLLSRDHFRRHDVAQIIQEMLVYEDRIEVYLKPNVDAMISYADKHHTITRKGASTPVHVVSSGDPLEIYTDRDGEVILKKYSPIGEMSSFAKDYTESLFRSLGHIACIVDRDQVVAASGVSKKELWDKPISRDLEQAIASRQTVALNRQMGSKTIAVANDDDMTQQGYTAQVISPIIADGEAIGAVLLMSREQGARMGDTELKVAETAAGIVGRQMEQ